MAAMGDLVTKKLAKPIQLTDQIAKAADEASGFKQECAELKTKTDKLGGLLRQAARASSEIYERPAIRIIDDTGQVLESALSLVLKCKSNGIMKRVFTMNPSQAFRKMSVQVENSIGDVSWLLRVSAAGDNREIYSLGLPPITVTEPSLGFIWEQIALLHTDSRGDAAATLVSLAGDNDRNYKMIIEEGGVPPLLKVLKEGKPEAQENAAKAIGLLGRDPESVEQIMVSGVCTVFAKLLKEGPMTVQAEVASAVAKLAKNHPKSQDLFNQNNVVRLLVGHLSFETIQDHSKYTIPPKPTTMGAVVNAASASKEKEKMGTLANRLPHSNGNNNHQGVNLKGRENENPSTKLYMKEMAASALLYLAKGNSQICRSITESRALLCFAVLMEKGSEKVQKISAEAVMEITAVAEKDRELRISAFKPNSLACKAVVDQLLSIVETEKADLLVPCVRAIGNLARTFRATETRMIAPLVRLLDEREAEVATEAAVALGKFTEAENFLRVDHSKAIVAADGARHLVQLVYFGDGQGVRLAALRLLCCVSRHVAESPKLAEADALKVVEWASKQAFVGQDEDLDRLVGEAKSKLEIYQSRNSNGFATK